MSLPPFDLQPKECENPAPDAWVSAYDVTADVEGHYPFSIDRTKVAAALRSLASRLESDTCVMRAFTVMSRANFEDYPDTFVRMRFTEGRL